jgi:hypothetical protein
MYKRHGINALGFRFGSLSLFRWRCSGFYLDFYPWTLQRQLLPFSSPLRQDPDDDALLIPCIHAEESTNLPF